MLSRTALIWLNRLLWTVVVGAVLAFGAVVSLGRHYMPYIESHQREVIDALNRRTGLNFSAGHIAGRWHHLSPHFVVDDLRLHNPQNPSEVILHIEHAELQLGIFRSIAARTVAISQLRGNGVQLQLIESPRGRWHLPGFEKQGELKADALLDLLLAIYRASLSDTRIDLQFVGGERTYLGAPTWRLQRSGDFRRINLALTIAAKSAPFALTVEANGDPRADSFNARGHAAFHGLDLTPLLPVVRSFGVHVRDGLIDGETWLDWRAHNDIQLRGHAALPQLDLVGFEAPITVNAVKADFLMRAARGKRELWLPRVSGTLNGVPLQLSRLTLSSADDTPDLYRIGAAELPLAMLRNVIAADTNVSAHLRDIVATLEPRGNLRNVRMLLPLKQELRSQLRLRAELDAVAVNAWGGAPGVEGGGGYIDAGPDGGTLDLISDDFAMNFPHVYREPLRFDRVRGRIGWHIEGDHVLVASGPIPVQGAGGHATAQFSLDLPTYHGGRPLMTLVVGLRDSAAQYHRQFVPYTVQPTLLDWLQHSVRGGKIPRGGFIYRGSLRSGEHAERTVQLFLDVDDGELAYQPEWPPAHHLDAGVWVDDGDLIVRAKTARLFDRIAASDIVVELQHPPAGSWLTVRGTATGEGDDVLRLLRESPLHQRVGAALDTWRWRGKVQSQLDLGFPLGGGGRASELRIDSTLGPGTLTMNDQHIVLTDVRGALNYHSDTGLQADAISARWYDKPLLAKVITAGGDIRVEAAGRIGMSDLKSWLQQPLFDYAEGDAPFAATLKIAGDNSALEVQSDLEGAALLLPPPYRKTVEEKLPLTVRMSVGANRELKAELSDWADLQLRWGASHQVDAGLLRLAQTGKAQLTSGQMIVTGRVPTFDLDAWREASARVQALQQATQQQTSQQQTDASPSTANDAALALYLRDIRFDKFVAAGQTLTNLQLSGHRDADAWQLGISSLQLSGTLRLPDSPQQPWAAKLNYLRLPASAAAPESTAAATASVFEKIDPAKIIPLDLGIDRIWRGSEEFGSLALQLRPIENGVRIDNIAGQLRGVTIGKPGAPAATMSWTRVNGVESTAFSARLEVADIGDALQRWKYEPVLRSKSGESDVALRWPGAPDQFQFTRAEGEARARIEDGRFLKASSSTSGVLKVVGIFNFANFLKRLQLDFTDVFKDGVSFDSMRGGVVVQNGVLKIDEPVEIKSPSSRFRVAGEIDFNTDQTDMELVATLPIASNLPWVAALAAGLPVAAGVYVASKVFENQVDRFSSAAYAITGPWADPTVKLRRVFNDKLPQKTAEGESKEEN